MYERAGLQYIEPELREGLGEIALAAERKLPRLLEDGDLRGSLHNHSTYSDGNHSCAKWPPGCATTATSTWASATTRQAPTTPTA